MEIDYDIANNEGLNAAIQWSVFLMGIPYGVGGIRQEISGIEWAGHVSYVET
jgi:hypothetical protein